MRPARWFVLALGIATYVVAAKTHGRQMRLERELAGYWHVTFGGKNPAFVEALWSREQLIYWSLVATLLLLSIGFRVLTLRIGWRLPFQARAGERSWIGMLLLHVLIPLTIAFVVAGLLSLVRFVLADPAVGIDARARPADWLTNAAWGSVGWWLFTLVMVTSLFVFAWRRQP